MVGKSVKGAFAPVLVLGLALGTAAAAAAGRSGQPFPVLRASLAQDAQQLVWKVELGHPFSAAGLRQHGRALCLQLERVKRRTPYAVICLGRTRDLKRMRLYRMKLTARGLGPVHAVTAALSRDTSRSLTARFLPASAGLRYDDVRWQVLSAL